MWTQIVAKWRTLRSSKVRWSFYQCVQNHTWGGPSGWINNRQGQNSDQVAQDNDLGPWVSQQQGDPDSQRGWLYDLVDVLAVHCYHNRLVGWDTIPNGGSTFENIRNFHRDECRHGAWLSQTRYGGRKPVMPYVAWREQGLTPAGTVAGFSPDRTQITLDVGTNPVAEDF
jgi:hypothetical protein